MSTPLLSAILIAIAIPTFTSQLERSREATDAANIRAQYAEVMVKVLDNSYTSASPATATVDLQQQQEDWQANDVGEGVTKLIDNGNSGATWITGTPKPGGTAVLTWEPGTATSGGVAGVEGHISLEYL